MNVTISSVKENPLRLYNATQAAEVLGVHRNTIYNWIKAGWLKPLRNVGGRAYLTRQELDRFAAGHDH